MTDLEDRIREALRDPARQLPAWPDPMPRIRHAARRQRIRLAGAGAVTAVLAAGLAAVGFLIAPAPRHAVHRVAAATASCQGLSSGVRAGLGMIAFVRGDSLRVLDLATCRQRVLVAHGGNAVSDSGSPSFSPDGRWIALVGSVIPAAGGRLTPVLGAADPVAWSPTADILAGVTSDGGVVVGGPGQKTRHVLPARWGAEGTFAFDPTGRQLAVTRYPVNSCANGCPGDKGVWVVDLRTGRAREVYRVPSGHDVSPLVNGWSPDGKWVLFQPEPSNSIEFAGNGLPLYAVPADGRPGLVRVMPNLLLEQPTLLTWCGEHLVVSAGINKNASFRGLHLVAAASPAWQTSPVSRDSSLGFAQPACDPTGTWVATVAGASNDTEASTAPSALWVMRPDGSSAHEVAGTGGGRYQVNIAVDQLQWSADGRWILFTRERVTPDASAPTDLYLAEIDPATGRTVRMVGPVLRDTSTYAWSHHEAG